jgi:hypothetical protein
LRKIFSLLRENLFSSRKIFPLVRKKYFSSREKFRLARKKYFSLRKIFPLLRENLFSSRKIFSLVRKKYFSSIKKKRLVRRKKNSSRKKNGNGLVREKERRQAPPLGKIYSLCKIYPILYCRRPSHSTAYFIYLGETMRKTFLLYFGIAFAINKRCNRRTRIHLLR